jgi:hypothetical protein
MNYCFEEITKVIKPTKTKTIVMMLVTKSIEYSNICV